MEHLRLPEPIRHDGRRQAVRPVPAPAGFSRRDHGGKLLEDLDALEQGISVGAETSTDDDLPLVLKLDARTRIADGPLKRLQLTTLGEGRGWTYFVLSDNEARALIRDVLGEYSRLGDGQAGWDRTKALATALDAIDGVSLYGREDRRDAGLPDPAGGLVTVDCVLWPSETQAEADRRIEVVRAALEPSGSEVVAVDPVPQRTAVRVDVDEDGLSALLDCDVVERVRPPLRAVFTQGDLLEFSAPGRLPAAESAPVGVVDGIVSAANPLVGPYVLGQRDFPHGHTYSRGDTGHGTAVAGQAIWGSLDPFLLGQPPMSPPAPVLAARVVDGADVVGLPTATIEEAVRWLASQGVRVVNLSVNKNSPAVVEPLRDELTLLVDELARELDLVVVVPSGNREVHLPADVKADYPAYLSDPEQGIRAPGDAALAVTVGSSALRDVPEFVQDVPVAHRNQPSPFTGVGPARSASTAGLVKPDMSAHGGNWSVDPSGRTDKTDPGVGVIVAVPPAVGGRVVGANWGTSFAAPSVAHEIAAIAARLPDASANLLRALALLSARVPDHTHAEPLLDRYLYGYGQPSAERVAQSDTNRVFLLGEYEMATDSTVFIPLPIPPEYAQGSDQREFRVALAFDPPVRRSRREYLAGTMTVDLVRDIPPDELRAIYDPQPARSALAADPSLRRRDLPDEDQRPPMQPGPQALTYSTALRRDFVGGVWRAHDRHYHLVVQHARSPWTVAQKNAYQTQRFAVAVEVAHPGRLGLDLYALMRSRLRATARSRPRATRR